MATITMTTKSIMVKEPVEQLMKEIKESDFNFIHVTEIIILTSFDYDKEPKRTFNTRMINVDKIVDVTE